MKKIFIFSLLIITFSCGWFKKDEEPQPNPKANFTFERDNDNPFKVTFKNTSENADTYEWNFGDGKSKTRNTEEAFEHEYDTLIQEDKNFSVKLIAKRGDLTDNNTVSISITGLKVKSIFTYTVNGLVVVFRNQSELAKTYEWDFGDGSNSTETDPAHEYPNEGRTYTVRLLAKRDGVTVPSSQEVTIVSTSQPAPNPQPLVLVLDPVDSNDPQDLGKMLGNVDKMLNFQKIVLDNIQ